MQRKNIYKKVGKTEEKRSDEKDDVGKNAAKKSSRRGGGRLKRTRQSKLKTLRDRFIFHLKCSKFSSARAT